MKYLMIVLLFLASCGGAVERVGETEKSYAPKGDTYREPVVVEKVRVDTVYIDKTGNKTPYTVTDGKIVPQENVHYRVLKAYNDSEETVVKIVSVMKNKHNVAKVWYTHNVFKTDDKFLGEGNKSTIVTLVKSHQVKSGHHDRHFIEVRTATGYEVDKVSAEVKELGREKFEELLTKIINE